MADKKGEDRQKILQTGLIYISFFIPKGDFSPAGIFWTGISELFIESVWVR